MTHSWLIFEGETHVGGPARLSFIAAVPATQPDDGSEAVCGSRTVHLPIAVHLQRAPSTLEAAHGHASDLKEVECHAPQLLASERASQRENRRPRRLRG